MLQFWRVVVGTHGEHVAVGEDLGDNDELAPQFRVETVLA